MPQSAAVPKTLGHLDFASGPEQQSGHAGVDCWPWEQGRGGMSLPARGEAAVANHVSGPLFSPQVIPTWDLLLDSVGTELIAGWMNCNNRPPSFPPWLAFELTNPPL